MKKEAYILLDSTSSSECINHQERRPVLHPALQKPEKRHKDSQRLRLKSLAQIHENPPNPNLSTDSLTTSHVNISSHQINSPQEIPHRMSNNINGISDNRAASYLRGSHQERLRNLHHQKHRNPLAPRQVHQPQPQQQQHNRYIQQPYHNHHFSEPNSRVNQAAVAQPLPDLPRGDTTYNTHWTERNNTQADAALKPPDIYIPTLDLTAITLDDNDEDRRVGNSKVKNAKDAVRTNEDVKNAFIDKRSAINEEKFMKERQKPTFVFPPEKSISNLDSVLPPPSHITYENPESAYPLPHRSGTFTSEDNRIFTGDNHLSGCPQQTKLFVIQKQIHELITNPNMKSDKDKETIHFSLSNPKHEKYIVEDNSPEALSSLLSSERGDVAAESSPQDRNSAVLKSPTDVVEGGGRLVVNEGFGRRASNSSHFAQEVDVVVVDGHLAQQSSSNIVHDTDGNTTHRLDLPEDGVTTEVCKDKPRPRVTFCFEDDVQTSRSLKRYTPIKMDVKPLQGVLKKRPELTRIDDSRYDNQLDGSKHNYFNDSNTVFRKSAGTDQGGIRVKHLNNTSSDLNPDANRRAGIGWSEKPPIAVSHRVVKTAADKALSGSTPNIHHSLKGSDRNSFQFSGGLKYVCSNAQGRIAYFRPPQVSIRTEEFSSPSSTVRAKSRSSEDIHSGENARFFSALSTYTTSKVGMNGSKTLPNRSAIPSSSHTLRRAVSSDNAFPSTVVGNRGTHTNNTSSNGGNAKPRVAFGSFIIPKEASTRVKKAQVTYQEVDTVPRASLGGGGAYVHSHTRRTSPYAAPTQVLFDKSSVGAGSPGFRRPYTAQVAKVPQRQRPGVYRHPTKDSTTQLQLAQRHSAPSSLTSAKERNWRATGARSKISVNNSPSRVNDEKVYGNICPPRDVNSKPVNHFINGSKGASELVTHSFQNKR